MKVVALIENIPEDKVILDELFSRASIVPDDVKYISFDINILGNEYQEKAQDVYDGVIQMLQDEGIPTDTVDLRLVVDLILRPNDDEDFGTPEPKTGLIFIRKFVEEHAEQFESVHSFLMSKNASVGSAFEYNKERLLEIEGGVSSIEKPVTVVSGISKLADGKSGAMENTDILDESLNTRYMHVAFVNAVIYGERH